MEMLEAKALVEKEKLDRTARCAKRIQEVLKEENCAMDVGMVITVQGNIPKIEIRALEILSNGNKTA